MSEVPFAVRFRDGRQRRKLTQAAVAKTLRISQSAVAQWESGRSYPSADLAAKIEKLIGVAVTATDRGLQAQDRRPLDTRPRLPIIGLPAPGDNDRTLVDDQVHGEILAPPQLEAVAGAKAVYVRGRSMEPRYYPGEVVYLHPSRQPNPGDFVFVTVREKGFPAAIGYIRQYLGQDLVHLKLRTLSPKAEVIVARDDVVGVASIVGSGLF
jgi:transcriptional regulator with XRE-family HTH domain